MLVDPALPGDVGAVNVLQDKLGLLAAMASLSPPSAFEQESLNATRDRCWHWPVAGSLAKSFATNTAVDPAHHLINSGGDWVACPKVRPSTSM